MVLAKEMQECPMSFCADLVTVRFVHLAFWFFCGASSAPLGITAVGHG